VLLDRGDAAGAAGALLAAVGNFPCNWPAWKALLVAVPEYAAAAALPLPDHFAARFFAATAAVEAQRAAEALAALRALAAAFPASQPLLLAAAQAHYSLRNYDEAAGLFEELLAADPHRLEGMDTYSNILYVKEERSAVAALAQRVAAQDRFRPESCATIGNYYSLRGQHEKAVVYFRRALRLDPHYLPAWTLMGHEFVELKNPPAAIEAYRRAVALAPRDYRAWYGLGQTYELVNMPHHALHYYRRAVALRPGDARMWNAMGHCLAAPAVGAPGAALRCYRRALPHDREGVALRQLAVLHEARGERAEAARYHAANLARVEAEGLAGADAVEALRFLADYARGARRFAEAEALYVRLLDCGVSQQREVAKAALRAVREELARGAGAGAGEAGARGGRRASGRGGAGSPGSDGGMDITPTR
jgi:anaphase-promoting complex subunit 8